MERSHIPLTKWVQASQLMNSSKKGMSAKQLERMLGTNYETAWFLAHRLREAMAPKKGVRQSPLGGEGKFVEADTTYVGGKEKNKHRNKRDGKKIGGVGKQIVHTLVERDGSARSHHITNVNGATLRPILMQHVSRKSSLMTDTAGGYMALGKEFARHEMVDHGAGEYVRDDAHSNTVEGFFSILKRGVYGTFHAISEQHLGRYLSEFDFKYNTRHLTDVERANAALKGSMGKRLTYHQTNEAKI
jgi:transposase-like protein